MPVCALHVVQNDLAEWDYIQDSLLELAGRGGTDRSKQSSKKRGGLTFFVNSK